MGLKAPLLKESNRMFTDYPEAYWSIDYLTIESAAGVVAFSLNAYPSKASKSAMLTPLVAGYSFGTPEGMAVDCRLYTWQTMYPVATVFPDGIPLTEAEQKDILYPVLKADLAARGYTFLDVFEEGQIAEG